jgi:hypothetical protein
MFERLKEKYDVKMREESKGNRVRTRPTIVNARMGMAAENKMSEVEMVLEVQFPFLTEGNLIGIIDIKGKMRGLGTS